MHHELSIAERVKIFLENNFEQNQLKDIKRIDIGIGKLVMANEDNIREAFDMLKKDTVFQDVEINFVTDELRYECKECGKKFSSSDYELHCPECGGNLKVLTGEEIYIKNIERLSQGK
ncbi:MAG: hydrogenase maturation nickel metallochaperone HypA [Kosmotogaceae bacterium]